MAKTFSLSVDIVMNKYIDVEAETEEEAVKKLEEKFSKNPYDYTNYFNCYVGHEVISVEPSE
jgi:hypothetical protein